MADRLKAAANQGIIGLSPPPWDLNEALDWPTGGYDQTLHKGDVDWSMDYHPTPSTFPTPALSTFAASGYTKAEWVALADEMVARWTAWRALIAAKPEEPGNG